MSFPRLLVRQRLAVLAAVPLVGLLLTTVPLAATGIDASRRSGQTSAVVDRAVAVARLAGALQRERLLSVAYVVGPGGTEPTALARQSWLVGDAVTGLRAVAPDRTDDPLRAIDGLAALRLQVLRRSTGPAQVLAGFGTATAAVLDVLGPDRRALAGSADGTEGVALLLLLDADERAGAAGAGLLAATAGRPAGPDVLAGVLAARAVEQQQLREFRQVARAADVALLDTVLSGASTALVDEAVAALQADPTRRGALAGDRSGRLARIYAAVDSQDGLRRVVTDRIAGDAVAAGLAQQRRAGTVAVLVVLGSLLLVVLIIVLSSAVGRSIVQPLARLTGAAGQVADISRAELQRVADDERADEGPPRLAAVDVGSPDELGDLALAINRVQATAVLLLDRQVAGRRNVATMLGNIGRRTQTLVGRQLGMIDELERTAADPELLERLYRLDHVSIRLRRSANSLLVLSGRRETAMAVVPLSISDVLRAAAQEIEDFTRLRLGSVPEAMLAPAVLGDLIPLLAELLENGISFSPPGSMVEVDAEVEPDGGVRVRIVDHGIGMTDEQLAEENARLVQRERLDLAPTDVLGLFVVGRLARRHGLGVRLAPTSPSGITAEVWLPAGLIARRPAAGLPPSPAAAGWGASAGWDGPPAAAEWSSGVGWDAPPAAAVNGTSAPAAPVNGVRPDPASSPGWGTTLVPEPRTDRAPDPVADPSAGPAGGGKPGWGEFDGWDGPPGRETPADWSWWNRFAEAGAPDDPEPGSAGWGGGWADPAPPVPAPAVPAPPGTVRLSRRVPGAQLPGPAAGPDPYGDWPAEPPLDPLSAAEAARALVDEFRSGAARALTPEEDGPA